MRLRVLALALTMVLATPPAAGVEAGSAGSGIPREGPLFSTPRGYQINHRISVLVRHTAEPAVIRAATGITDKSIAENLVAAHRRGVDVRLVIPGNTSRGCASAASQRLIGVLGTNLNRRSWVKCIQGSARNKPGTSGHMHMKVWAFTKTGGKKNVLLVTSQNATDNGGEVQYNDAYMAVGWAKGHNAFRTLFGQLQADSGGWFWQRSLGRSGFYATPLKDQSKDPILRRIRNIPARNATIRVAVSTISYGSGKGHRSNQIARLLARKKRNGANIAVIYTKPAGKRPPRAVRIMRDNGIAIHTFDNKDTYIHNKFMTAVYPNGRGGRVHHLWTGSEEWKESSYQQDEFVLRISRRGPVRAYNKTWRYLRAKAAKE